jgi:hypothetical protein
MPAQVSTAFLFRGVGFAVEMCAQAGSTVAV